MEAIPTCSVFFVQSQLEKQRNYAVYFFEPTPDSAFNARLAKLRKSDASMDQHAGERETSTLLYLRPDLVKMERATNESGINLKRLSLPDLYTGIWWYGSYPNHYAGEGAKATRELGELVTDFTITSLVKALKAVKADTKTLHLQKEFYDRVLKNE